MEDSKPILPGGTGTPYLAIFDSKGKPIIEPKSGLPLGMLVTNFSYEYIEEKEDKAEISIECDNPDIVDHPSLRTQSPLSLQWGWIYPDGTSNNGPIRKVVIRDRDISFGENGIKLEISCTDAFALTKVSPAQLEDRAFRTWVKNNIEGKFYIDVVDYSISNKVYIKQIEGGDYGKTNRQRNK